MFPDALTNVTSPEFSLTVLLRTLRLIGRTNGPIAALGGDCSPRPLGGFGMWFSSYPAWYPSRDLWGFRCETSKWREAHFLPSCPIKDPLEDRDPCNNNTERTKNPLLWSIVAFVSSLQPTNHEDRPRCSPRPRFNMFFCVCRLWIGRGAHGPAVSSHCGGIYVVLVDNIPPRTSCCRLLYQTWQSTCQLFCRLVCQLVVFRAQRRRLYRWQGQHDADRSHFVLVHSRHCQ